MFYLNEDNIDDLFREASENYQLPTDAAADWERITQTLHESPDEPEPPEEEKKKKRRFAFWYLLFIPLGWLGNYVWTNHFEAKQNSTEATVKELAATKKNDQQVVPATGTSSLQKAQQHSVELGKSVQQKKQETIAPPSSVAALNTAKDKKTVTGKLPGTNNITTAQKYAGSKQLGKAAQQQKNADYKSVTEAGSNEIQLTNNATFLNNEKPNNKNTILSGNQPASATNDTAAALVSSTNLSFADSMHDTALTSSAVANKPIDKKNSSAAKKTINLKSRQSGFYAGAVFAPDITTIKLQHVQGIGSSFGVIAGYKINNRWSIETGFMADEKKYYTRGSDFNKAKIPYLYSVNLTSVNGTCNMIEIPLTARYTFSTNKKGNFTASLGSSTYYMNREYYSYYINMNGEDQRHDRPYYPGSQNFFAVLNLGAGYERTIGHTLTLRAEPYLKIALTGIGTGSLPMSGAGINIAVLKLFHK